MGPAVAGTTSATKFRPTRSYTTLWDVTTWLEGVIMQRPNEPGYCRPDAYVIDDLR
jgi:hypothetical protein